MTLSFIVAAALLVFGQSAEGASADSMPFAPCLTIANEVATKLQASVDFVAGQHVAIDVIGGTVALPTAFVSENRTVIAEVDLSGSVVVMNAWCDLEPLDKDVAMAHELGHVIDRANDPVRYFLQLPFTGFLPWNDRPTEQRANDYARQILKRYNEQRPSIEATTETL